MADTPTQRIAALTADAGILRADLNAQIQRIGRLERDLETSETQVADLRGEVAGLRDRLSSVEGQAAALKHLSDRSWGFTQALIILALTVAASAITQLALRK